MADFFFFTDIDLLSSQTASQAYGPAGTSGGNELFRVTSLHSATGSPKAYAMCDGMVCIQQDQSNSSIVNLILKPTQSPDINCPVIKYVLYKGILKSSLLDGSGGVVINASNDLTASIKRSWDAYTTNASLPASAAPEDALGIDINSSTTNFSDTDPIDHLFYRDTVTFQFPTVSGGWLIGDFDATSFGIEIITEKVGYDPLLKQARNVEHLVSVPSLPGSYTNVQFFNYWHLKEEILNYVDPCAFYGSFYASKVKAKTSSGSFNSLSGNDIYDQILKGVQNTLPASSFYNKNTTYIDIRNDNNQSINYYKNYGNDIQVACDSSSAVITTDYYQSGWPLLAIDNSSFPVGNTSSSNVLRLTFPLENNTKPLLYISQGYQHYVINTFRKLKNKKKFVELTYNADKFFTDELTLVVPNNSGIGSTCIISSISLLRYFKQIDPDQWPVEANSITQKQNVIDNIFAPFNMTIPFSSMTDGVRCKVYEEETFINKSNSRNQYTAKVGIAEDIHNIHLFAYAKDIRKSFSPGVGKPISVMSEKTTTDDYFISLLQKRSFKNQLSTAQINLSAGNIDYLTFSGESYLELGLEKISRAKPEELIVLSIDKSTFSSIQSLIAANSILTDYKIFFGAQEVDRLLDDDNKEYSVFEILLRGFINNSGNLELIEVPTTVKMYSHDTI